MPDADRITVAVPSRGSDKTTRQHPATGSIGNATRPATTRRRLVPAGDRTTRPNVSGAVATMHTERHTSER
jgi:hypothetical protein